MTRLLFPFLLAVSALFSATCNGVAHAADGGKLTLEQIIKIVRVNEAVYENLDVSLTRNYVDNAVAAARAAGKIKPQAVPSSQSFITEANKTHTHCVLQNGMFRGERKGVTSGLGQNFTANRIRAFDGNVTRLFEQNQYGNIIPGRAEDELIIRPHMLLFSLFPHHVPLSTYLSGHEAMRAYPDSIFSSDYTIDVKYQGEVEYDGLKCHHISITTSVPSFGPYDRWELWLAEERNFIPVRKQGYTFRWSKTDPLSEGSVDQWQEVAPQVWFPKHLQYVCFDQYKPLAPDVRKSKWIDTRTIEKVSLTPAYPVEYFRDVPFPDGVPVYRILKK